ncbi:MAG TPA: MFS transporter, partial [Polyangiaceae bacterium]|nr:MFS transporter [Polyangiaceae bacterium]
MPEPIEPGARRWTLSGVASAALAPLNSTMIAVALPEMARDLQLGSAVLRHGLVTSYLLTGIVLQSLGGKLADRIGYGRALRLGQVAFASAAVLGFAWPRAAPLLIARILMAAAGAVLVPSAVALLRSQLPPERRGRAFGVLGAVTSSAAAIGPKVGSLLTQHFGWRSIFLINVPWLLLWGSVAWLAPLEPRTRRASNARFDLPGALLLGVSLGAIVLGSVAAELRLWMLAGVGGLAGFVLWERRAPDPLIDLGLFRRRVFSAGSLVVALHNLAMYSLLFELPQMSARLFGPGREGVGTLLSAMMASTVIAAPIAGRLSDRLGPRSITFAGSISGVLGVLLLGVVPFVHPSQALPGLILLGLGLGLATSPAQAAALSAVPRAQSGMAAGVAFTLRYLGGIAGLSILAALQTDSGEPRIALAEHHAVLWVFGAALMAAGICCTILP